MRIPLDSCEKGATHLADLPIACELTPAELQTRGASLLPGLVQRATQQAPATNGYRWTFAPAAGLLEEVAQVVAAERECCRFLRFTVAAEPDGGPISLEVTGPVGTIQFLDQLLAGAAA
jgi:hypothetical protein